MKLKSLIYSTLTIIVTTSCDKTQTEPTQPYDNGVIVVNAGNFTDNNGTLSLIERTSQSAKYDIFKQENQRSLAGGISGYAEVNEKGIILVDNSTSGKDLIEIVNARTFKSETIIPSTEIENPRNVVKVSETKAYVTAWDATGDFSNFYKNAGFVAVLDLTTNKITKKITVQNGAESIFIVGIEAFIGNVGGKTTISVIDISTDTKKTDVEVGKNPTIIGVDANNKLWIYAGNEMVKLNISTKTVESRLKITSSNTSKSPSGFVLSADKKTIYFTNSFYDATDGFKQKGETYGFSIDASSITANKPFINRLFSGGIATDPLTGTIYCGVVPSYKQAGYVLRYKTDGILIDSVKAEIAPSKFFFKK